MKKIFLATDTAVSKALRNVLSSLTNFEFTDSEISAGIILTDDKRRVMQNYQENKNYVLVCQKDPGSIPENVKWLQVTDPDLLASIIQQLSSIDSKNTEQDSELSIGVLCPPRHEANDSLSVLVIDDKLDNLTKAIELLNSNHFVTLADSYRLGKQMINANTYDAVLSDCQMLPDFESALADDAVPVGETVHNGIFLMFDATRFGARFAIVTDANHHQDWVSAIFDDIREPQTVNGHKVQFFNYLGKSWDKALEKLME